MSAPRSNLVSTPTGFLVLALLLAGSWLVAPTHAAPQVWHTEKDCRWAELAVPSGGRTGFTLLPPEQTGLAFTNTLDELRGAANRVLHNGSGVAVGDFDNDGLPDIFLCGLETPNTLYRNLGNWKFKDVTARAGLTCTNWYSRGAVFADLNGDGFVDLLVSTTGQGVLCYLNNQHGGFTNATVAAGTATPYGSVTMALADIDGNGTLDLYVANNRPDDIRDRGQVTIYQNQRGQLIIPPEFKDRLIVVNGKVLENGEPDVVYLNDGHGRFTPLSWTDGRFLDEAGQPLAQQPLDWGLTVTFRDLNSDGFPDIYECNDYWSPDRIWINDGQGRFRALDRLALRHTSASSMGMDLADIDRDGHLDFFVLDMLARDHRYRRRQMFAQTPTHHPVGWIDNRPQIIRNTLMRNRGDGTFEDLADYAGVPASDWSWQSLFLDVDLDGYEDLLIPTGHTKDVQDMDAEGAIAARQRSYAAFTNAAERHREFIQDKLMNARLYPKFNTPIVAFRNLGNLKFEETTKQWGTDHPGVHHGLAVADFDGDGAMDLVVNNLGTAAGLYRNNTRAPRVAVRLKGLPPNTQGIGSRIKLLGGAVPMQSQEIVSGGRYLSGCEAMIVFAAGQARGGMSIEVAWRSGAKTIITNVLPNRLYEIEEARSGVSAERRPLPAPQPSTLNPQPSTLNPQPFFTDVTSLLSHTHAEEPFNDFERQPLLPKRLSQLGPGVSWFDANGDGHDDLIIASGRGGELALFHGDGCGGFQRATNAPLNTPVTRDQTTVLGWRQPDGATVLLAGSANYEDGLTNGSALVPYLCPVSSPRESNKTENGQQKSSILGLGKFPGEPLPDSPSSTGPLALGDVDGDGNLELFVGGRVLPGRYPEAASSRLFKHDGQQWILDAANSRLLEKVGLVSGAVWSDLDGDGYPELILACEWGPIKIFRNNHGHLTPWDAPVTLNSQPSTLNQLTGWWSGVTTGDLDGDGRLDLIVANWGLNSPYRATPAQPACLVFGDLAGRESVDLIETEYDPDTGVLFPRLSLPMLSMAWPALSDRFATYREYSEAPLAKVLGDVPPRPQQVKAATLASMVFFNRTNGFVAAELPREAQFAPAFAVNVADLDGDGHEDVFLSQNFFCTQPEVPRLDAGRSLWLKGDGTGQLRAVPGQESGLKVYGEQRGAALGDFNEDGRVDLAVTQNGAATCLFQNTRARPGLRVKLLGAAGNLSAVGAVLRLKFGARFGPACEIHAGSGYWSQDSAVTVLSTPSQPTQISIRWPGGQTTTSDLPPGAREITVDRQGTVKKTR